MNIEGATTITGKQNGPTVTILGGVHGDETCGVKALARAIKDIKIDCGKVNFIYGNPRAIKAGIRFIEMNLNRAFRSEDEIKPELRRSYERIRALEIMPFLKESSALLDIHSSMSRESTPFVICEPHSFFIARKFPFSIISHGWDNIEPGGTDFYMNQLGRYGICVECGFSGDAQSIARAYSAINIFLAAFGLLAKSDSRPIMKPSRIIHVESIYHTKTDFKPAREFADFEIVRKSELIGHDGDEPVLADSESIIIFCRKRNSENEEAFILAKEEKAAILTN